MRIMRYSVIPFACVATLPARDGVCCETLKATRIKASVVFQLMDARLEVWNLRFYWLFLYFFILFRPVLDRSVAKSDATCMGPNLSSSVRLTIHRRIGLAPPRKYGPMTKLYSRIANWASTTELRTTATAEPTKCASPRRQLSRL